MTDNLKELKIETIDYIDKEVEHVEDKINTRLLSLEKVLESIELSLKETNCKIYNDSEIKEICKNVHDDANKKIWSNVKWALGLILGGVFIILAIAITMWADVRDYTKFKEVVSSDVSENLENINTLEKELINHNVIKSIENIEDDISDINEKIE